MAREKVLAIYRTGEKIECEIYRASTKDLIATAAQLMNFIERETGAEIDIENFEEYRKGKTVKVSPLPKTDEKV